MTAPNGGLMRAVYIGGVVLLVCAGAALFFILRTEVPRDAAVVPTASEIENSTEEAVSRDARIVIAAFGDSVTAGYGLDLTDAYPAQLEGVLKDQGYVVSVMNAGVSGETTAGGLRRASFVAAQKPDIVLIALGGNDMLRGIDPATTENNLREIMTLFKERGIAMVLVGMRAPSNLGETYRTAFDALYPKLAATFNVPLIPFLLEGIALNPILNQNDGIHPNEAGARMIATDIIAPQLVPILDAFTRK